VRRHDLDVFSLVLGLFMLGAAGVWTFADPQTLSLDGWPLPALLIAVGLIGLAASVANRRSRQDGEPVGGVQPSERPVGGTGPSEPGGSA
jgi:hypothetical protein